MAEYWLTVAEAAELLSISERGVRKNVLAKKYGEVRYADTMTRCRGGREIRISLSSMPISAQSAYMKQHKLIEEPERIVTSAYDTAAEQSRKVANRRYQIMKEYELYIAQPGKKTELTKSFVTVWNDTNPDEAISKSTLYNWQRAHKKDGLAGLLPNYGGRKGQRIMDKTSRAWEVFTGLYLKSPKPKIKDCYDILQAIAIKEGFRIPDYKTVWRMAKNDIPKEVEGLCRHGEKFYYDNCAPHTRRDPDSISAGEVFVGDHHVLDVSIYEVINGKGRWVRPWLTAWLDMRSWKFVSWTISLSPCTDTIISSFAMAALDPAIGLPREIYIDNGQDYCAYKFAGRGHRGKKLTPEDTQQLIDEGQRTATLMDRLQIKTHNAIVENARAKVIERAFKIVSERFSKHFPTYCGNRPGERPEGLDAKLKQPEKYGVSLEQFDKMLSDYLRYDYNKQVSQGVGRKGECPDETFMRTRLPVRTADPQVMRLFFMKSTNPFKIGRNGITFKGNEYYSTDMIFKRGQSVYIRYRDDDLSQIWFYNTKDEYLGEAKKLEAIAAINADKEVLEEEMARKAREKKAVKAHPDYQAAKKAQPLTPEGITELRKLYGHQAPDVTPTKVIEMVTLPRAGKEAVRAMQATGTDGRNPFEILAKAKIEKRRGEF